MYRTRNAGPPTRTLIALLAVVLLASTPNLSAAPGDAPDALVEGFQDALNQAARDAQTSIAKAKARLTPVVRATHAIGTSTRLRTASLAGLTSAQTARLAEMYARVIVHEYAQEASRGTYLFLTARFDASTQQVVSGWTQAGRKTKVQYVVAQLDGRWYVTNRIVDGRNENADEAARLRAEYQKGGFDAVMRWLESRLESGSSPTPTPGGDKTATQVVARLQAALLDVMKNASQLGFRGRYQRIEPVVKATHHIPAIARLTIRRYWKNLSEAQQRQLVQTFGELSVSNYASKFDGYSGERFSQTGEEESGKSTIVRTVLTKSNGETVRLDYTLRQVRGRWRILNITADGVSDLSTKQAEYGSVMASGGFPALIAKMQEQIRRYQTGS